jgi:hypothetical protein
VGGRPHVRLPLSDGTVNPDGPFILAAFALAVVFLSLAVVLSGVLNDEDDDA